MKAQRRRLTRIVLFLAAAGAGCSAPPVEYYRPEQVEVEHVSVDSAGHVEVDFRTMAETLYYCPGIDFERDGDTVYLAFVRRGIRRGDDGVMRVATPMGDRWRVELDAPGIAAINVSDDATSRVTWQRPPASR